MRGFTDASIYAVRRYILVANRIQGTKISMRRFTDASIYAVRRYILVAIRFKGQKYL